MTTALNVWFENRLVGRLLCMPDRRMAFSYDGDWLTGGWAISCSLPLEETGDFLPPDLRGHFFFANLLPEGNARNRLVRQLGIADDDFLLLEKTGEDCAGALQLLPEGESPDQTGDSLKPLSETSLLEAIKQGRAQWLDDGGRLPRLSLAGAQDKIPVRATRTDEGWAFSVPLGGAPSTHILKLPISDLKRVPLIESYTNYIGQQLGLPIAPVELVQLGDQHASLSLRYDRDDEDGLIRRRHQEDFCQAQGLSHVAKYNESADTFRKIGDLIRRHCESPALDLQAIARWQIFNALAGNADGHLKNLSLLATPQGRWKLAPFYDLVCTLAIENVSHLMALPIGGKADPGNLHRNHWDRFADDLGVGRRLVQRRIRDLTESLSENLDAWHEAFIERHRLGHALDTVHAILKRQIRKSRRDWLV